MGSVLGSFWSEQFSKLCERCLSMFSTTQALRALASPQGYVHSSCQEIQTQAQTGCELCTLIYKYYSETWWTWETLWTWEQGGYVHFAAFNNFGIIHASEWGGYPMNISTNRNVTCWLECRGKREECESVKLRSSYNLIAFKDMSKLFLNTSILG